MDFNYLFKKINEDFIKNKKYILISWKTCKKGDIVLKNNNKYKASNYDFYSIVESYNIEQTNDHFELKFLVKYTKKNKETENYYKNLIENNFLSIKIHKNYIENLNNSGNLIEDINIFNNIPYIPYTQYFTQYFMLNNENNIIKIYSSNSPENIYENGYSLINFIDISETEYDLEKLNNEINMKIKLFDEKKDIRLKLVKSIIQEMKDQLDDDGLKEIKDFIKNNQNKYHSNSLNQNL